MSTYTKFMEAIIDQLYNYADLKFDDPINVTDDDDVDDMVKAVAVGINFMGQELKDKVEELGKKQDIILKSLKEKELLLSEIHHRVKNNLQVLSAVIKFQINSHEEPGTKAALYEVNDRVMSMAEIQELIYKDDDFLYMDFSTYCLKLCSTLSRMYGRGKDVTINYDMEPNLVIDLENARHIGSFINEVIVNSYKHQFPWPAVGVINISLKTTSSSYILSIADNGINKPATKSDTLGQKLLHAFAKQLKGSLEINSENGYSTKLTFPKKIID